MDASFSRSSFPPGGWQFHQAQTGWSNPHPMMTTFDGCVRAIIKHREQNPALCIKHNWSRDPIVVGNELEAFTRLRCGWPTPQPVAPPSVIAGAAVGVVGTVDEIKRLAFGTGLLINWAESGEPPVDQALAEERAKTCANCPYNDIRRYEEWLNHPLNTMLKQRISRLIALKLSTRTDAKLGICNELFAPCNFLVHEPSELVTKKIASKPSVKPWDQCWLKKG